MVELTEVQKKTLAQFISGADELEKAIAGLSEEELDCSITPDEWSIRQIVHHVSEDGDAWSLVVKQALVTPGTPLSLPKFPGNEAWASGLAFDKRPIGPALALFKAHRDIISQLAESFPDAWERYVTYPDEKGNMTNNISVDRIIRMMTEHLAEHIATIEAIRQQYGI